METADDLQLIEHHVAACNHGVRTGDWEPMLANLTPDARMTFPGLELSGVEEIRAAYAKRLPDDTIELLAIRDPVAPFRWVRGGSTGTMTFELLDGRVSALAVRFDER